ncbi:MAG: hypothetical protein ACR2MB_00015 [Acidimicrobiales bacterium]
MSNNRRKNQNRRRKANQLKAVDLWRPVPQLPDPEPIVAASDPTMVLRSLGEPPLHGSGAQAAHEISKVLVRAAHLAEAVAAASGLHPDANGGDADAIADRSA